MKKIWLLLLSTLFIACACERPQLTCNFSVADISALEDEHLVLAGFAARTGLSDGIHIPLKSSCLVVSDGTQKVCLVSNDLMEISPALAGELRDSISARSGLARENILLHSIHTHSAPRMGGVSTAPGGPNVAYRERTFNAIVANAVKTILDDAAYAPFRMEIAKGTAAVNFNRCEPETGPVDPDLYAARFLVNGKPLCALFNIACHPVAMGHKSLLLSSDYSGVARRAVEPVWGCPVFQLTGAAGNMDPKGGCQMVDHAEEIGAELADALKSLKFKRVKEQNLLKIATGKAELPYLIDEITPEAVKAHADALVRESTNFPRFASDVRGWEAEILERFKTGEVKNRLDFNMTALNLDGVLFFFTQGEPFCEYQTATRAAFPDRTVFFAGYTNGQNSYLPSTHAYEYRKGYEYEIEQMHVYIKAPYPLSHEMPEAYQTAILNTLNSVK